MNHDDILNINAHLKYVEYLLNVFDNCPSETTIETIRHDFENRFRTRPVLLNQYFGIYRLLPLILIKEEYKKERRELAGTTRTIKTIRDSVAHGAVSIDENGYLFQGDENRVVSISYADFPKFLHQIENEFYRGRIGPKDENG